MKTNNITNRRLLAVILFTGLIATIYLTSILTGSISLAHLVATYPSIPGWVVTSIQGIANVASAVGMITAILGTLGLASIASVAVNYIRTYGVRYGIAL